MMKHLHDLATKHENALENAVFWQHNEIVIPDERMRIVIMMKSACQDMYFPTWTPDSIRLELTPDDGIHHAVIARESDAGPWWDYVRKSVIPRIARCAKEHPDQKALIRQRLIDVWDEICDNTEGGE
jgi:hypothetical protein